MTPITSCRRAAAATVVVALVLVLGACTSSSDVTDPTTSIEAKTGTIAPGGDDPDTTRRTTTTDGDGTTSTTRRSDSDEDDDDELPTGDETAEDYSAALVASFEPDADEIFTAEVVRCVAPKWIDAIGVENLQSAGITPNELATGGSSIDDVQLSQATAEAIVDAVPGCGLPLLDLFLDGLPPSVPAGADTIACIEAQVTEDQIRGVLVDEIRGVQGEDPEDLVAVCLD